MEAKTITANSAQEYAQPCGQKVAEVRNPILKVLRKIINICPYTHIFEVIKTSIKNRKFSATAQQGFFITILGILCPFFWIALFSGAPAQELRFHATHSGVVASIGIVLIIVGLVRK